MLSNESFFWLLQAGPPNNFDYTTCWCFTAYYDERMIFKILLYVVSYFESSQWYWFRFRSFLSNLPGEARPYLLFLSRRVPSISIIRPLRSWFTARGFGYSERSERQNCTVTRERMRESLPHYRLRICRTVCRRCSLFTDMTVHVHERLSIWRLLIGLSYSMIVLYCTECKYSDTSSRKIPSDFIGALPLFLELGTLNLG